MTNQLSHIVCNLIDLDCSTCTPDQKLRAELGHKTMAKPKYFADGRIHGGCSMHEKCDPTKCPRDSMSPHLALIRCGPWRVVDCCGVNDGDDIEECHSCGRQRTVACNFDEDYS